jgi:hypothetical protein
VNLCLYYFSSLFCFIDKEKDFESKLGDFGVRKYEDGVGLFTSPDPLWESNAELECV